MSGEDDVWLYIQTELGLPRVSFHQHMPYAYAHVLQTQDNGIPWTAGAGSGIRYRIEIGMDNRYQLLYTRAHPSI